MSEPPLSGERIHLSEAVSMLAPPQEPFLGRTIIKSRASRGLLDSWVERFEEVAPKGYDDLVDAAHARALSEAEGDQLWAAIVMQDWQVPADAEWEVARDQDVAVPPKFWAMLPDNDPAWTAGTFLGRVANFDGYEQNWMGLFFRRCDVEALPRPDGAPGVTTEANPAAPTVVQSAASPPPERLLASPAGRRGKVGLAAYDKPYVAEMIRRYQQAEFPSHTAAAWAILSERRAAGERIQGQSDEATVRRWQRRVGAAESDGA